jgi:AcrR family transcriptional regulator
MPASALIAQSASRTERKRARNREALLSAARRLFVDVGFEATTVAAIAEAADLGFGTFYRYFPDKEAILDALLDVGRQEFDEVLSHPENEQLPPEEALAALTHRYVRAVRSNIDLTTLVWRLGLPGDPPGAGRIRVDQIPPERSLPGQLAAVIRSTIERGVAAGAFQADRPDLAAHLIAAAHMYVFSPTAARFSEQALVQTLCEFQQGALGMERLRKASRAKGRKSG